MIADMVNYMKIMVRKCFFLCVLYIMCIAGCADKEKLPVVEVTHERVSMSEAADWQFISIGGMVIRYQCSGQDWEETKGSFIGQTESVGPRWTAESRLAYLLPGRSDYTYILIEKGDTEQIYVCDGIEIGKEGYFGQVWDLLGIGNIYNITEITLTPGISGFSDSVAIQQSDTIKAVMELFRKMPRRSLEEYEEQVAKRGTAKNLECAAYPEIGALRDRIIRIQIDSGYKTELQFDPICGYIVSSGGYYEVPSELYGRLIDLGQIEMDEATLCDLGDKYKAAQRALKAINRMFLTAKGIQDEGYFAAAYTEGIELVVLIRDTATEEDIQTIQKAAAYDRITFLKAKYTAGELSNICGRIRRDRENGLLPFVAGEIVLLKDNRISVEITENTAENLRKLMEYVPNGDPDALRVILYEPLPLIKK